MIKKLSINSKQHASEPLLFWAIYKTLKTGWSRIFTPKSTSHNVTHNSMFQLWDLRHALGIGGACFQCKVIADFLRAGYWLARFRCHGKGTRGMRALLHRSMPNCEQIEFVRCKSLYDLDLIENLLLFCSSLIWLGSNCKSVCKGLTSIAFMNLIQWLTWLTNNSENKLRSYTKPVDWHQS